MNALWIWRIKMFFQEFWACLKWYNQKNKTKKTYMSYFWSARPVFEFDSLEGRVVERFESNNSFWIVLFSVFEKLHVVFLFFVFFSIYITIIWTNLFQEKKIDKNELKNPIFHRRIPSPLTKTIWWHSSQFNAKKVEFQSWRIFSSDNKTQELSSVWNRDFVIEMILCSWVCFWNGKTGYIFLFFWHYNYFDNSDWVNATKKKEIAWKWSIHVWLPSAAVSSGTTETTPFEISRFSKESLKKWNQDVSRNQRKFCNREVCVEHQNFFPSSSDCICDRFFFWKKN